ncbi:MAG: hypothetical protein ACOY82_06045 [Pseudomonadota bacterium]
MRILIPTAVLAVMLALPSAFSTAFAEDSVAITASPDQIRTAQADLRQAIERKSGNYSHFTDDERKEIFSRQDQVLALIEGKASVDELASDDRIALANALAAVDAAVSRAEDNRLICERIKPIGSNRPQNKCMTVGQRRQLREASQQQVRNSDR